MKIIFGEQTPFESVYDIVFKNTFFEKAPGWDKTKLVALIVKDNEVLFTSSEIESTGCSMARRSANKEAISQCFDWMLKNIL